MTKTEIGAMASSFCKDCEEAIKSGEMIDDEDGRRIIAFVGTVFSITPSGKYYTPWTTNQTEQDQNDDNVFWQYVEAGLSPKGITITCGFGHPCDIFAELYVDEGVSE